MKVYILHVRACQIRSSIVDSLQYQVRYEYNITGKFSNRTDTLAYRITSSWDRLQTKVNAHHAGIGRIYSFLVVKRFDHLQ